jgi:hypothetical protein
VPFAWQGISTGLVLVISVGPLQAFTTRASRALSRHGSRQE